MNNEKMLNNVLWLIDGEGEEFAKKVMSMVDRRIINGYDARANAFAEMLIEIKDEIRAKAAKESGKKNELAAAKRILKIDNRFSGAFFIGCDEKRQVIMSPYCGVILNESIPAPPLPKNCNTIDIEKIINPLRLYSDKLELPAMVDLNVFITESKAKQKGVRGAKHQYDFGKDLPLVNAEYLRDIMILLGDDVEAYIGGESLRSPIYFKSSLGEGILCPTRKD